MTGIGKKFPNSPVFDTVMNASPEVGINHTERLKKNKKKKRAFDQEKSYFQERSKETRSRPHY